MNLADILAAQMCTIRFYGLMSAATSSNFVDWTQVTDAEAKRIAAEIEKARTVRTVEELDALPAGAVVLEGEPVETVLRKHDSGGWIAIGIGQIWKGVALPARVLWLPTDEDGT